MLLKMLCLSIASLVMEFTSALRLPWFTAVSSLSSVLTLAA